MKRETIERKGKPTYDAPAARMVIRLVEVLCESEVPLGVTELCQRLGSNANMVFRLLQVLEQAEWVMRIPGVNPKYAMGLRPFHYVSKPVRRLGFREAAEHAFRALHERTRQSCYLGLIDGTRTLLIEHLDALEGDIRLNAQPGGRYLMHCAAPGKVLLAYSDAAFVRRVAAEEGLPAQTPRTITSASALASELSRVRKRGYALDMEEFAKGLYCCAVPVFDVENGLAGTVGVSVLALYWTRQQLVRELVPVVMAAADSISEVLGATRRCATTHTIRKERKG
ncbi:MAG: IclR family transcriptional regulator [Kiritimatiellaeota bacterium]|nr:IclR family transcriptional regulator [Kiritimatiellota bacterium]